ncbi:type III polyketide synthase [bacterium]|nr:type III polyketide synthase [bacterium]
MKIVAMGTSVPDHSIEQSDSLEIMRSRTQVTRQVERLSNAIYQHSGVATRHSVILERSSGDHDDRQSFFQYDDPGTLDRMRLYEQESVPLALNACRKALDASGLDPARISQVVTVSCTGFFAPSLDLALIDRLGIPLTVGRTHIGFMGCHGLFNGLRVANAFTHADPEAVVLVCAVELCSLHHQYEWTTDKMVANALFADGAAAIVGVADDRAIPAVDPLRLVANGSTIFAGSEFAMSWKIGDHGFEMTLSPETPRLIHENLRPWLEAWLAKQGLTVDQVGSWAVHPGGPRILQAFAEAMGLPIEALDASYHVLNRYGNMSSPTVAFVLERLRSTGAPLPCVAVGFGPGLTTEAALLR